MATNGIQMPLKYQELKALATEPEQKWTPDGSPNRYAFSRGNRSVTWVARISHDKKRKHFTLGNFPDVKSDKARAITPAIKLLHQQGYSKDAIKNALTLSKLDPIKFAALVKGEKISSDKKTDTFEMVATNWYENHLKDGLSERAYKRQVMQQLQYYVFPHLGSRPINEINQKDIFEALSKVWKTKKLV